MSLESKGGITISELIGWASVNVDERPQDIIRKLFLVMHRWYKANGIATNIVEVYHLCVDSKDEYFT